MSIIRVTKRQGRYLVADAEVFEDSSLSFGARGLMAYLLTKPNNWEVRRDHLVSASPAGRVALQRMINELKEAGYMHRSQENDPKTGKFVTVTEVFETKALKNRNDAEKTPIYGGTSNTVTTKPAHGPNGSFKHLETDPAALPPGSYIGPPAQAINSMISTISGTCKGFANFILGEDCPFYQAAVTLLENGVTEEQIFAFRDWWKENGYYEGKPAVPTLMSEIENAIGGVKAKRSTKPTPIVQHAIEDMELWVKGTIGIDEFRSAHTLAAVRKVGEPALKGLNQYNRKALIGQFVSEFERARKGEKVT